MPWLRRSPAKFRIRELRIIVTGIKHSGLVRDSGLGSGVEALGLRHYGLELRAYKI